MLTNRTSDSRSGFQGGFGFHEDDIPYLLDLVKREKRLFLIGELNHQGEPAAIGPRYVFCGPYPFGVTVNYFLPDDFLSPSPLNQTQTLM